MQAPGLVAHLHDSPPLLLGGVNVAGLEQFLHQRPHGGLDRYRAFHMTISKKTKNKSDTLRMISYVDPLCLWSR
jgi:hypothetical protein